MRKAAILFITLIIMTSLVACDLSIPNDRPSPELQHQEYRDHSYTIRVTGSQATSVIEFSGNYMILESNGGSSSRSVDGYTPAEYTVRGYIVSCAFQKMGERGLLKVEILKGGEVVNSSYTTAAYGMVSVATP